MPDIYTKRNHCVRKLAALQGRYRSAAFSGVGRMRCDMHGTSMNLSVDAFSP
jgi:hypothetical protein